MINFPRLTMRNINRLGLALALFAPIVYLFGTQFAALAGSHGQEVLANNGYIEDYIQVYNVTSDGDYRYYLRNPDMWIVDNPITASFQRVWRFDFVFEGVAYDEVNIYTASSKYFMFVRVNNSTQRFLINNSNISVTTPWIFDCVYDTSQSAFVSFVTFWANYSTLYKLSLVPSSDPVESYVDNLFGQLFPRDNFLVQWGENSLDENPVGFAPIGTLFKYVDDNMLHFASNDTQWGMMIYGYLYWSAHVLLFDLVFYCGTFFITLFKNIVDKLGGVAE